jgi:hypothetical protein
MDPSQQVVPFEAHASLPANAILTPYRDGARRLWTVPDHSAIYIGTVQALQRWGRVKGDAIVRTDCG